MHTLIFLALLSFGDGAAFPGTWKGHISDLKCGTKIDAECTKKCLDEGQQAVLVQDGSGDISPIANSGAVKKFAGEHVEIKGTQKDDQITVREIRVVKE